MTWWRRYGNVPYRNALGRFEFEPHEEPDSDVTPTDRMRRLSDVGEPYRETMDLAMFAVRDKRGRSLYLFNEVVKREKIHGYDATLLNFGIKLAACQRRIPEEKRKVFHRFSSEPKMITCHLCRRRMNLQ